MSDESPASETPTPPLGEPEPPRHRASDVEAALLRQWNQDREDATHKSFSNVRHEATMLRAELRADIEKVSDAARERAKELHEKIDRKTEKLDERADEQRDAVTALRTELDTLIKLGEKKDKGEFDDGPFYARPTYIKAMGLAIAAILAAILTSLGLVLGWGGGHAPPPPPDAVSHEAPADPGATEGDEH